MGVVVGKVMPRPMGNYNPATVYEILDMVSLNNKLWIARRSPITNIEPSLENSDYWMMAVDGTTDVNNLEQRVNERFETLNVDLDDRFTELEGNISYELVVLGDQIDNNTVFANDGTITKTYVDGRKEVTKEQADGTLVTEYYTNEVLIMTKTVTEDSNGNISVTYKKVGE